MKESEVIERIEEVFAIEDPAILPEHVRKVSDEILEGNVFPTSHPFYADFISLSFDVLYPEMQQPVELLKRSGFTREEFEKAGFMKLVDTVRQVSPVDAEELLGPSEEPQPKRRKKVSWGANLAQVKEIERTVMDPGEDYFSGPPKGKKAPRLSPDTLEWIVPRRLDHGCASFRSPGLVLQEEREARSMKMCNTEEHRKFSPTSCADTGKDNETVNVAVVSFAKKTPVFDFRKIVEDRSRNMASLGEILEDPSVLDALLRGGVE